MRRTLGSRVQCFILQRTLLGFWPLAERDAALECGGPPEENQRVTQQGRERHKEPEAQYEEIRDSP